MSDIELPEGWEIVPGGPGEIKAVKHFGDQIKEVSVAADGGDLKGAVEFVQLHSDLRALKTEQDAKISAGDPGSVVVTDGPAVMNTTEPLEQPSSEELDAEVAAQAPEDPAVPAPEEPVDPAPAEVAPEAPAAPAE